MKSLRKSLNGNKDPIRPHQISTPLPLPAISKPPSSVLPPQKVIRALTSYRPQAPQELSFQKGDFFYVLRDIDDQGAWYEAHNPVSGARGLVPRTMFEEFGKNIPVSRTSHPAGSATIAVTTDRHDSFDPSAPKSPKSQVFYAVVLHDFVAERADELEAKRGDSISVVAQSNREWFVAKPIGRLGRPGLIPVTFVEIRDPATNQPIQDIGTLMDRGELPNVEDWKRAMMTYKQNSIPLGVIEDANSRGVPNSPFMAQLPYPDPPKPAQPVYQQQQQQPVVLPPARPPSPDCLPEGILLSADLVSFHYEMEDYWFRIDAIFQPYPPKGSSYLPAAKHLILFRVYNDFYDFQVTLLDTFPREAGRKPPHVRLLPYMPGPTDHVDDEVTARRRGELDEYLHKLCELNATGGKYILEHHVVRSFLALRSGDVENPIEARVQQMQDLFGYKFTTSGYADYTTTSGDEDRAGIRGMMSQMKLSEEDKSDGSQYEEEEYAPSPQQRTYERIPHPYNQSSDSHLPKGSGERRRPSAAAEPQPLASLRQHALSHSNQRSRSISFDRDPSPRASNSRSNSPMADRNNRPARNYSPSRGQGRSRYDIDHANDYSHDHPITPSSVHSQPVSTSGRSRSGSTATSNVNSPPISAANLQAAFIKIKIFDRVSDDLIAIRVHPRVSHAELMVKVHSRLEKEISQLRYRDSISNTFVDILGDDDLRRWLAAADKHVLYAD